ncbi:Lrp/AsnC family transcriptional regulator [Rhodoligotrophos ferricapiens]|uniref:Lrp/AsnC family transcriptional regulator n=1 Tax=Rhodoligotrophos ferricapiens TaxID=3069264 RepID=UPI00315C7372
MASVKLDAIDLRILSEIQKDGRITKIALAERVGLSATPCWMRLKRLEAAGLICGYHARIALKLIAPFALVFMEVTLGAHRQSDFDRFERAIKDVPEVISCWSVGGGLDYLLKVLAPDIDAYQRLVDELLARDIGIDRYFTYIVTKVVKDEPVLPLETLLDG